MSKYYTVGAETFEWPEDAVKSRDEDSILGLQRITQSSDHPDHKLLSNKRRHSSVVCEQEPAIDQTDNVSNMCTAEQQKLVVKN